MVVYKGSAASGAKTGVLGARPRSPVAFSNLPRIAHSHSYSAEIPDSEQPPFLQTFLGNVGMWE